MTYNIGHEANCHWPSWDSIITNSLFKSHVASIMTWTPEIMYPLRTRGVWIITTHVLQHGGRLGVE